MFVCARMYLLLCVCVRVAAAVFSSSVMFCSVSSGTLHFSITTISISAQIHTPRDTYLLHKSPHIWRTTYLTGYHSHSHHKFSTLTDTKQRGSKTYGPCEGLKTYKSCQETSHVFLTVFRASRLKLLINSNTSIDRGIFKSIMKKNRSIFKLIL